MVRTFISVDLPQEYHENISEIQSRLKNFNVKLLKPEFVHITLKFLGEIDDDKVQKISNSLDKIDCEPFNATIAKVGVFPKPKYPKVVWLGVEGDFKTLHKNVESLLKGFNFGEDNRKFSAHATIARVKRLPKKEKDLFLETLDEIKDIELGSMWVDTVKLKKSTLTHEGPIYETLHKVKLK
ncbi:MAG: RNA 2',3'-cyclic phosphodiesterase [Methanohalobium sp.]|uniref:RNA 2',3'-cyclic phosphodiesterase n=1 Tax=Methanohalobium sp. TaxID=2837493 RepID=UPI00397BF606